MAEESKGPVVAALGANFAIAVGKIVAGVLTGSAALLAEAGHSIADTVNQVFLLIGINRSDTTPDEKHPMGYGKEAFFWSFLAAIFIFVAGAAFSFYEGTRTLIQDEDHARTGGQLLIGFGVLGFAIVFESISWAVAVRGLRAGARAKKWSLGKYIRESPDITLKTVLFEDSAALIGLVLAAGGLGLSELTGNEDWDGIASLLIGVVLAVVAFLLGAQSRKLLLGSAASDETQQHIRETLASFPEVVHIVRVLTIQLGSHSVLVTGELNVKRDMNTDAIEDLLVRIDTELERRVPEVADTFWELKRTGAVPKRAAGH